MGTSAVSPWGIMLRLGSNPCLPANCYWTYDTGMGVIAIFCKWKAIRGRITVL